MKTNPGRLCSRGSVLLATRAPIQGSCKTNPVPGSCCYCENVKTAHPLTTDRSWYWEACAKNQHALTVAALATLPAQAIPKYSLVFFRKSSESLHERKAPWIIIKMDQIKTSCFYLRDAACSTAFLSRHEGVMSSGRSQRNCEENTAHPRPVSLPCLIGNAPGVGLPR